MDDASDEEGYMRRKIFDKEAAWKALYNRLTNNEMEDA
jgi:hypothetical protein